MSEEYILKNILGQMQGVYSETINSLEDKEVQPFIGYILYGIAEAVHKFHKHRCINEFTEISKKKIIYGRNTRLIL